MSWGESRETCPASQSTLALLVHHLYIYIPTSGHRSIRALYSGTCRSAVLYQTEHGAYEGAISRRHLAMRKPIGRPIMGTRTLPRRSADSSSHLESGASEAGQER